MVSDQNRDGARASAVRHAVALTSLRCTKKNCLENVNTLFCYDLLLLMLLLECDRRSLLDQKGQKDDFFSWSLRNCEAFAAKTSAAACTAVTPTGCRNKMEQVIAARNTTNQSSAQTWPIPALFGTCQQPLEADHLGVAAKALPPPPRARLLRLYPERTELWRAFHRRSRIESRRQRRPSHP